MFKIEITEKGAHMSVNGKTQELPKGHVLEVETIPGFLINKCRKLSDTADMELMAAEPGPEEPGARVIQPPEGEDLDEWREYYFHLSGGKQPDKRWGIAKLQEAIAELTDGSDDNGE